MHNLIRSCWLVGLSALLCAQPAWAASAAASKVAPEAKSEAAPAPGNDIVLASMQKELHRAQTELGKLSPATYFISYTVYDGQMSFAVGMNGSLLTSSANRGSERTGSS